MRVFFYGYGSFTCLFFIRMKQSDFNTEFFWFIPTGQELGDSHVSPLIRHSVYPNNTGTGNRHRSMYTHYLSPFMAAHVGFINMLCVFHVGALDTDFWLRVYGSGRRRLNALNFGRNRETCRARTEYEYIICVACICM